MLQLLLAAQEKGISHSTLVLILIVLAIIALIVVIVRGLPWGRGPR